MELTGMRENISQLYRRLEMHGLLASHLGLLTNNTAED
jgi:hypothetical protein